MADINNIRINTTEMKAIDANRYATKKTIAQGMLDIALLTANASQLKYILQIGEQHQFYKLTLILISLSIVLQFLVGVLFIVIGSLNINREKDQTIAKLLNDIILIVVFIISVVNVIISGFSMEYTILPEQQTWICAGLLLMVQSMIRIHKSNKERHFAEVLNHIISAIILLSVFCDIIKINFIQPDVLYPKAMD